MRTLTLSLLLAALALLSGCMQHNGHIGDWFGTWHVESISTDSTPDEDYAGNVFFQFQASVVRAVEVRPHEGYGDCFGAWAAEGNTLTIDYNYTTDSGPSYYRPLPATHMIKGLNVLTISERSARRMTWTMTDAQGQTITFKLKKQ